jgi:hypothetical protein
MTIRMRFWQRAVLVLGPLTVLCLWVWSYLESHDLARSLRQFAAGKPVTWPPAHKRGARGGGEDLASELVGRLVGPARTAAIVLLASGLLLAVSRLVHRRRRARQLATFELRLSRDDVANPYRVQEAFEGIVGAIQARWYERLWRGQDHFALEVHSVSEESIHFTLAAPRGLVPAIAGALEDLYPDVRLIEQPARPGWTRAVTRLKKRRSHVLSLQTTRNYEHSLCESLVALLGTLRANTSVQLVLTPAPALVHDRSRRLLKRRERSLNYSDRRDPLDPGMDSVVEAKELKGALETQHRSLLYFDLRVAGEAVGAVRRVAGLFGQVRSENELVRRDMRLRRRLYSRRIQRALPNPTPGLRSGILSTSELATLWQLPRARAKLARIPRSAMRRAVAPPEIARQPELELMRDERGPVGLAPGDRKYGHALIGGQGGGKTSGLARHWRIATADRERTPVLVDGKGPFAEAAIGMVPADRTVHYIDLAQPAVGFNPLQIGATPGATAAVFVQALIEANPPGAIQAASDSFLRQAIAAVCTVERNPTLWHVYRMLELGGQGDYRDSVVQRLDRVPGTEFARNYWQRDFPALIGDRGFAAQALNPPRNKLERLISTRETDILLRHPVCLDLDGVIERGEVLIVNAAKAHVGEDNARLIMQLLLQLLHRQVQAQQRQPEHRRRRVSLLFDEAHNVLTPSVATMLAEGRSAGLEAVFAWQYSAQIANEMVRSGVRSLLQSISIFRMREMEDARSLAGLAMDVYSDRISVDHEDQERLRFSADDITRLEVHHAINLWVAGGTPRPGFVAQTLPWEDLHDHQLAAHHYQAQLDRGGRWPGHLRDPFAAQARLPSEPSTSADGSPEPASGGKPAAAPPGDAAIPDPVPDVDAPDAAPRQPGLWGDGGLDELE